ncbi:hypothetical protein JKP88DRAFT_296212 [Tribonema minus]|uniref:J domain-containing protein n=1 Tax=Tribonema minus TaxID=303371 RepID=A0A835ZFJ0_9STRA|nr:hypothetical protein JKP88DRAFT_296212 [Tribonema minus]
MPDPQHKDRDALLLKKLAGPTKTARAILYLVCIDKCSATWSEYKSILSSSEYTPTGKMLCPDLQHPGPMRMQYTSQWTTTVRVRGWKHPLMWEDSEGVHHVMTDVVRVARYFLSTLTPDDVAKFNNSPHAKAVVSTPITTKKEPETDKAVKKRKNGQDEIEASIALGQDMIKASIKQDKENAPNVGMPEDHTGEHGSDAANSMRDSRAQSIDVSAQESQGVSPQSNVTGSNDSVQESLGDNNSALADIVLQSQVDGVEVPESHADGVDHGSGCDDMEKLKQDLDVADAAYSAALFRGGLENTSENHRVIAETEEKFRKASIAYNKAMMRGDRERRHAASESQGEDAYWRQQSWGVSWGDCCEMSDDDSNKCTLCDDDDEGETECPLVILGLICGGDYDMAEIKSAYRKASLKAHPDKRGGKTVDMQRVAAAYEKVKENNN